MHITSILDAPYIVYCMICHPRNTLQFVESPGHIECSHFYTEILKSQTTPRRDISRCDVANRKIDFL